MPAQPYVDLSTIDKSHVAISHEQIYEVNPHRYEFMLLDGIYFVDKETQLMAGYRDVKDDEFWVRGHIPDRPLFPGVLMIEASAQLVSYFATTELPDHGFMGFAGVENVKFRGQVVPGDHLIFVAKMVEVKSRRCVGATQAFVDGKMVYEGLITGMWL